MPEKPAAPVHEALHLAADAKDRWRDGPRTHEMYLITSIPPKMRRIDESGADLGESYQRLCTRSWIKSGFRPVSVNSTAEIAAFPHLTEIAGGMGVEIVSVSRNAEGVTGKPHLYFSDLVKEAARFGDRLPVAITNADVMIEVGDELMNRFRSLSPGHFVMARRVDIGDPHSRCGTVYQHGFDFFLMHGSDLEKLADDVGLIFGMPWWDYYLPLALASVRCEAHLVNKPFVFHLDHSERWDFEIWRRLGDRFVGAFPSSKIEYLHKALRPNFADILRRVIKGSQHDAQLARLHRVSAATVRLITEKSRVA